MPSRYIDVCSFRCEISHLVSAIKRAEIAVLFHSERLIRKNSEICFDYLPEWRRFVCCLSNWEMFHANADSVLRRVRNYVDRLAAYTSGNAINAVLSFRKQLNRETALARSNAVGATIGNGR